MKILLIKTSSLGDVIHTLPALTDALQHNPHLECDWVIEENCAEIPLWHRAIKRVIPIALRRWRKNILPTIQHEELQKFWSTLRAEPYDYIIDAQGLLLKSGLIALMAVGERYGYNWSSAREPLASLCYQHRFQIPKEQHAITRLRQLFAHILNYNPPETQPNYGIERLHLNNVKIDQKNNKNLLFIHGTSRIDKCWPEESWIELANLATTVGYTVQLPWGNELEYERATRIAAQVAGVKVLPKMTLSELANVMTMAKCAIAVDTGLGHLAAALKVPVISLYGNTDPNLIGTWGKQQIHLKPASISATFPDISVEEVWNYIKKIA